MAVADLKRKSATDARPRRRKLSGPQKTERSAMALDEDM